MILLGIFEMAQRLRPGVSENRTSAVTQKITYARILVYYVFSQENCNGNSKLRLRKL